MSETIDLDYDDLDPGIRSTVRWLRSHGFRTVDSGDGVTKFSYWAAQGVTLTLEDGFCDYPHVRMVVAPDEAIREADRLAGLLEREGIHLSPLPGSGDPQVLLSYDPAEPSEAMLFLADVVIP